jgi:hypothetical protein
MEFYEIANVSKIQSWFLVGSFGSLFCFRRSGRDCEGSDLPAAPGGATVRANILFREGGFYFNEAGKPAFFVGGQPIIIDRRFVGYLELLFVNDYLSNGPSAEISVILN